MPRVDRTFQDYPGEGRAQQVPIEVGVSGDGDSASIGLGQFAHAMRRGVRMVYIVENNGVYGLTKGQFSATADKGSKSKKGAVNSDSGIDLVAMALQLGATFVAMVWGVASQGWWMAEMSALFLASAIAVGLVAWLGEKPFTTAFVDGARDLLGVALVIGLARGIVVIMDQGKITDTILHSFEGWISGMPDVAFVNALFLGAGAKVWGYENALWSGLIFAAFIIPVFWYRHYMQDGGKFPKETYLDLGLAEGDMGVRKAGILPYLALVAGAAVVLWANWFFVLPA